MRIDADPFDCCSAVNDREPGTEARCVAAASVAGRVGGASCIRPSRGSGRKDGGRTALVKNCGRVPLGAMIDVLRARKLCWGMQGEPIFAMHAPKSDPGSCRLNLPPMLRRACVVLPTRTARSPRRDRPPHDPRECPPRMPAITAESFNCCSAVNDREPWSYGRCFSREPLLLRTPPPASPAPCYKQPRPRMILLRAGRRGIARQGR